MENYARKDENEEENVASVKSDSEEGESLRLTRRREASDDDAEDEYKSVRSHVYEGESDDLGYSGFEETEEEEEEEEDEVLDDEEEEEEESGKFLESREEETEYYSQDLYVEIAEDELREFTVDEKEKMVFRVPKPEPFYMHDDRFNNSPNRRRYKPLGKKLWVEKDDQKWKHDKFEEINSHPTTTGKEKKNYEGHYKGQGYNRVMDHGYSGESSSTVYAHHGNQSHSSRIVRGRGPVKYRPLTEHTYGAVPTQTNQSRSSGAGSLNSCLGRASRQNSNAESDLSAHRNYVYASPSFSPSYSSQDISVTQTRGVQVGNTNRSSVPSPMPERNFVAPHSTALHQGETSNDTYGQYRDEYSLVFENSTDPRLKSFGSPSINRLAVGPVMGSAIPSSLIYQLFPCVNQVNDGSLRAQIPIVQGSEGAGTPNVYHGDPNLVAAPAFLPVMPYGGMQYSAQRIPAFGIAHSGYLAQPQVGFGNSEMTWMHFPPGPSGALGGTNSSSPDIAVNDGYSCHPSGHDFSLDAFSQETSGNRNSSTSSTSEQPELVRTERRQSTSRPRRYSKMRFDQ